jgi:hypothetical protein
MPKNLILEVQPPFSQRAYDAQNIRHQIKQVIQGPNFAGSGFELTQRLNEKLTHIEQLSLSYSDQYELSTSHLRFLINQLNSFLNPSKVEPVAEKS